MRLNICTCSFIVYNMSNSKETEYQIFVSWYYKFVEVYFVHITLKSHETNVKALSDYETIQFRWLPPNIKLCIIALWVQNVENIGVLCFAFIYCKLPWQPKYICFYAGEMSIYFFFTKNWRLQLKCLQFRNSCKMVIIRNQWIKEYLINLDNRKLNIWNFENYKNGHNSLILQIQAAK